MATEAEAHVEDVKSNDDVKGVEIKDAENIKVEDSQALKAPATAETQDVKVDEVKNEEIEQVKASEPLENEAVEILENPKVELESTVLESAIEADVDVIENKVDEINFFELSKELLNELAQDSVPNVDLEVTSEKDRETAVLEAAVEEVNSAEETSIIKASENVPEPALIEATHEEARTIEESIPNESKDIDEINFVELSKELLNELAQDSVPNVDLEVTFEKDRETAVLEAAVEEVKAAEETSPIKASENVPEPALIEATHEEARTIEESVPNESKDIEESAPIEVSENVPESAADNPVLLDASAGISEKDIDIPLTLGTDEFSGNIPEEETKVDDVSKVEEIPENILEPSVTEKAKESTQITDSSAAAEVPKSLQETSTFGTTTQEIQEAVVVPKEVDHEVETVSKTDEKEAHEAMTEEVKTAEEISQIQAFENIPEAVSKEAISEVPTEETKTTEDSLPIEVTENIIESVPEEAAENIEESAPPVVDTAVKELKISEDIPPVQVSDNVTVSETIEKEKPEVTESREKVVVSENVPETAVTESPVDVFTEEPEAVEKTEAHEKEIEAEETVTSETNIEAVSGAFEGDEKVEEKKENSLMQGETVVTEEPTLTAITETVTDVGKVDDVKETKDEDKTLVERSREIDVDNMASEKTEKDDENTKESGEATQAEVPVKSSNQKSNNIFTKMKHSIVKVKKAIIGKSPS